MKKRFITGMSALCTMAAFLFTLTFTACDDDDDDDGGSSSGSSSSPGISTKADGFTLNVPAYAANNTYDLENSEGITLTCSQPNYGGVNYAMRYYGDCKINCVSKE